MHDGRSFGARDGGGEWMLEAAEDLVFVRELQETLKWNEAMYYGFTDLEKARKRIPVKKRKRFWCLRRSKKD